MMMTTKWGTIVGINGKTYHGYYFHVWEKDADAWENESNFKKHILLEFLDYLKVLQYVKNFDSVYEIIIEARDV